MAAAILGYFDNPDMGRRHGLAARQVAVQRFSLDRMIREYVSLYDALLGGRKVAAADAGPPTTGLHSTSREG